jgi:phosphoribosylformimino-5-aminoimidazole carboxamide ribotide isomerase
MTGVNIEATVRLAQALTVPVIASGGLNDVEDIRRLCAVESEGITGCIAGRAIYDGKLDFTEALKAAAGSA